MTYFTLGDMLVNSRCVHQHTRLNLSAKHYTGVGIDEPTSSQKDSHRRPPSAHPKGSQRSLASARLRELAGWAASATNDTPANGAILRNESL